MPDSSIMLELCNILKITVNDLLSGEVVSVNNPNKELEKNLIEIIRQKEQSDKRLLRAEIFIGIMSTLILFALVLIAAFVEMEGWLRGTLIGAGFVLFLLGCFYALSIEQTAGYYECQRCGHRYVPMYKAIYMAPHMGRKRYMKCPKCNEKSWQKKTLSAEQEKD